VGEKRSAGWFQNRPPTAKALSCSESLTFVLLVLTSGYAAPGAPMTTHRLVIELRWSRNLALSLAIALAVPILAVIGLLTGLAAHPGAASASVALSAPTTLAYQGQVKVNGQPFNGAGQFKFAIVSTVGLAAFWTNDGTGLSSAPFKPASAVN